MELLLDTVNLDTIKKYADVISLAGVTSNPSIVKKERPIDFYKHMREVRQIIGKERTLHVQVVGQTAEAMLADAHMILEELDDQVYIKVPTDMTGLAVIKQLKKEGIHVTATAIYSEFQGYLAIAAGVDYLAPYYNRMINMNIDSDYRGIERDNLGIKRKNHEAHGFARKLRHRGKTRKVKGTIKERRGRFNDVPSVHERPVSCENRSWFGHWESDTVRGKTGRSALVTLVDRKSRYLLSQRVPKVNAKNVTQVMIDLLHTVTPKRVRTLTPDRGTEFAGYREVSQELSIPVYFPDPHAPQQRGTNENTNGLIREYFPKGTDLDQLTDQDIDKFVRDLNHQPRKVLSWKSPFEVFFGTKLRLI